jgi:hypothetical protein
MANLILNGSTSGSVTLSSPAVSGTTTLTLPTTTSTLAINGPAFSAYASSNQSITSGVTTKVTLDTEEFDTNSNFSSSRFTPTVAGYYQINAIVSTYSSGAVNSQIFVYKNGSAILWMLNVQQSNYYGTSNVSGTVYMNGSTDYIELYGYVNSGTGSIFNNSFPYVCRLNGSLVRSA